VVPPGIPDPSGRAEIRAEPLLTPARKLKQEEGSR
jgi:hypothetical protein